MSLFYPIRVKKIAYLIADLAIVAASYFISYVIRFHPYLEDNLYFLGLYYFPALILVWMVSFYFFQIYRIMWVYSNITDIYRLAAANVAGLFVFLCYLAGTGREFPGTIVFTTFLLSAVISVFYRILLRDYHVRKSANANGSRPSAHEHKPEEEGKRILVIGAGEAGRIILAEYLKKGLGKLILGFVDDDPHKVGTILNGKLVFSASDGINAVIRDMAATEVIIAMPSVGSDKINCLASLIRRAYRSIPIRVMPHQMELNETRPLSISLRDIGITDLIGRDEVKVDTGLIEKKFSGKAVLITGAGGSIGSEICRQLLKFNIKKIIAVGRGEFSIYNLIKTLNEYTEFWETKPEIIYPIVDVKDCHLLETVFEKYQPDIVLHAAAHKHVPLMEFNEAEAVQNNVMGTLNVLDLARRHGVGDFILISTDKAVNPTSVMGATKRLAEIITNYYHVNKGLKTSIVRFGNVIGSRGSVIPLFMEQIERGGPVTVTHPDVTRYFMSIPEASILVINAAALSRGGELFALDMGKQYRVAEIAQRLIEFYGYRSDVDIKIAYTGLRPGEKIQEDLFYGSELLLRTENEKIFIISERDDINADMVESFITNDLPAMARLTPFQIRKTIKSLVREFAFNEDCADAVPNAEMVSGAGAVTARIAPVRAGIIRKSV